MLVIAIYLFIIGTAAGSFVNALVWRLHEQSTKKSKNLSIVSGRSICVKCHHKLSWYDLIPVISWLVLRGRCRYCSRPISPQYPLVEVIAGIAFAGSYIFWPDVIHLSGQWLLFAAWALSSIGLLALAVYDLRWMLLPSRIIYPTLAVSVIGRLGYLIFFENRPLHALILWAFSLLISSGVFFTIFMVSEGRWIGYGDVRLGLITGTLLADPAKSLAMLFLASLIGTLVILPALTKGNKKLASKLPYGPFLITGTAVMVLFGSSLLDWYKSLIT